MFSPARPVLLAVSLLLVPVCELQSQTDAAHAAGAPAWSPLDVDGVVAKMAERFRARDEVLRSYSVDRVYTVENRRSGKSASLSATMIFLSPGEKLFEVRSAEGSGFLRKAVLNRIIETERENAPPGKKVRTAVTPDNYSFQLLKTEVVDGRQQYVMNVKPKRGDKLLFKGTIWVDAQDFDVTRVEAEPAKKPSFWTRKVRFVHQYQRVGDYWFPASNRSESSVWIFGKTTTGIDYTGYRVNEPGLVERAADWRARGTKLEVQVDKKDQDSDKN